MKKILSVLTALTLIFSCIVSSATSCGAEETNTKMLHLKAENGGWAASSGLRAYAVSVSLTQDAEYTVSFKYHVSNGTFELNANTSIAFCDWVGGFTYRNHSTHTYGTGEAFNVKKELNGEWNYISVKFKSKSTGAHNVGFGFFKAGEIYIADFVMKDAQGNTLVSGFDKFNKTTSNSFSTKALEEYNADFFAQKNNKVITHLKADTASWGAEKHIGVSVDNLTVGKKYTVSFKYKLISGVFDSSNYSTIYFADWLNAEGGFRYRHHSTHVRDNTYGFLSSKGDGQNITLTFEPRDSASHVLGFAFVGAGEIYITDFIVTDEYGYVVSFGFERFISSSSNNFTVKENLNYDEKIFTDNSKMLHIASENAGRKFDTDMAVAATKVNLISGDYVAAFKYGAADGAFNCDESSPIIFADWFNSSRYGQPFYSETLLKHITGVTSGSDTAFEYQSFTGDAINEIRLGFTVDNDSSGTHTVGFAFTGKGEIYISDFIIYDGAGNIVVNGIQSLKYNSGALSTNTITDYDESKLQVSALDVNKDGKTNAVDLTVVRSVLLKGAGNADTNRDGKTDILDLVFLKKQISKQSETENIEEYNSALSAELVGTTNKDALSYKTDEEITMTVKLLQNGKPVSCPFFKYTLETDDGKKTEETVSGENGFITLKTSLSKAGYAKFVVNACDGLGNKLSGVEAFNGGACANFDDIKQIKEIPSDFNSFWDTEVANLEKASPTVLNESAYTGTVYNGFVVKSVKINMGDKDPVYAYVTYPNNAAAGSLKAVMMFHGYGVGDIYPAYVNNSITVSVCAHSMELGREESYYTNLQNGRLKGYGFTTEENSNRDTVYFKDMILRDLQATRYVITNELWNGKDLTITGGSQGAFQATAVAALCDKATRLKISIPWMCDLGGEAERMNGWRPDYTEAMRYYDTVNFAKRITCNVNIEAGLGDYICPPSGVTSLYNAIIAPKTIVFTQNRTHSFIPGITFGFSKQ